MPKVSNAPGSPARFREYGPKTNFGMLIGEERPGASDGAQFRCRYPYEDLRWGHVPVASPEDVDRALAAARAVFSHWSGMAPAARSRALRRWPDAFERHADELARLQVRENGKTIFELKGAALSLVGSAHFFAALGEMPDGHTSKSYIPAHELWTKRVPMGVVAAITPWNNPLGLLSWKLFPALAAGNCMVIKPSEVTPASRWVGRKGIAFSLAASPPRTLISSGAFSLSQPCMLTFRTAHALHARKSSVRSAQ
jgi:aldehyde dehydrogenase (NAD+)